MAKYLTLTDIVWDLIVHIKNQCCNFSDSVNRKQLSTVPKKHILKHSIHSKTTKCNTSNHKQLACQSSENIIYEVNSLDSL